MRVLRALGTSVGTKLLLGLTGLALVGFLIFHLAGNLLLFWGPEKYNEHAHALISNPLVIPAELGLLALFLLHAVKAGLNFVGNRAARPRGYALKKWAGGSSRKTLSSTTMIVSGLVVAVFVVLHLITFKYGPYYASPDPGVRDLYRLLVEVFQSPGYVVFYVVCMLIVGMHLRHGVASAIQSLGLMPAGLTRAVLTAGAVTAVLIAGGFMLIPIWVYLFL
jgi:succinate dehydrogenase / fumarate reductase cytochrome b subunit